MSETNSDQETKLSYEDQAVLAIKRAVRLMDEGTSKLHSNGKSMDERARYVPSYTAPRTGESGQPIGDCEVHSQGLNDNPNAYGFSVTMSIGTPDSSRGTDSLRQRYWLDRGSKILYTVDSSSKRVKDSTKIYKCSIPETIDVMDEVRDLLTASLHPERQEIPKTDGPEKQKSRAGRFIGRLLGKK